MPSYLAADLVVQGLPRLATSPAITLVVQLRRLAVRFRTTERHSLIYTPSSRFRKSFRHVLKSLSILSRNWLSLAIAASTVATGGNPKAPPS